MTQQKPDIQRIFETTRVIAVVGASNKPERPSYYVAEYLAELGYRVIPVNPGLAGQVLHGETVYASLADIPDEITVDMVDIFRRSEDVPPVVDEALAALPGLRTVWMQMGIVNEAAAQIARERGMAVVMDKCPKVEYPPLFGTRRLDDIAAR